MTKLRLLLCLLPALAFGQSVPNGGTVTNGQVWTVAQWMNAWQSKADTLSPVFTGTMTLNGAVIAPAIPVAASFTATGCSNSTLTGGANPILLIAAGSFTAGVGGTCALTLNLPTAAHGWACFGSDVTSPTAFIQTARSVSSCTLSAGTASGDIVTFIAVAY